MTRVTKQETSLTRWAIGPGARRTPEAEIHYRWKAEGEGVPLHAAGAGDLTFR